MHRPLIITMGDPTGVGPELIIKALLAGALDNLPRPLVVAGDTGVLRRAAQLFGVTACLEALVSDGPGTHRLTLGSRHLAVQPLSVLDAEALRYGAPHAACGRAMLDYVTWACDRCLSGRGRRDGDGADQQDGHSSGRQSLSRPHRTARRTLRRGEGGDDARR